MSEQKNHHEKGVNVEEALSNSEAFIAKNKSAIIGIILGIIIAITGFILYKHYVAAPKEKVAEEAIFKGQDYFAQDAYELALNGDSTGYVGFIKIADQYSDTKTGKLAKAYAGLSLAQLGKYEEAVKYLNDFEGDDQMVGPAVKGALGNCYAQLNQLDKATATLLSAAKLADNNTLSPNYLLQAGLIFEKQGKYADAIDAYTTIKDKYFSSYQAREIDKYIERATALKK